MAEPLVVKINGDVSSLKKELEKASKDTKDLASVAESAAKGAGIAWAGLTGIIGLSIAEFRKQEVAVNQLNQAMANQGIYTKQLSQNYQNIATELQKVTVYGDEEIISAQAIIQTYIGHREVSKELTKATLDLAAAKKMDLASAADLVGKSIGTSTNALQRQGIEIDATKSVSEKYALVIDAINGKMNGQAEAAATGTGQFLQLKNILSDLYEDMGKVLTQRLAPMVQWLKSMATAVQENQNTASLAANVLLFGAAAAGLVTSLALAVRAITAFNTALAMSRVVITALGGGIRGALISTGIGALIVALGYLALNWRETWQQMQAIFKAFMDNIKPLLMGLGDMFVGVMKLDPDRIKKGFEEAGQAFTQGFSDFKAIRNAQMEEDKKEQDEVKNNADKKEEEDKQLHRLTQAELERNYNVKLASDENAARTKRFEDEKKHGKAVAAFGAVMQSDTVKSTKSFNSELVALQGSHNSTLKAIGKANAVSQVIIGTAESAVNIARAITEVVPFPFSIPLIAAFVGARIAFGAEQIGAINSAADGGILTGGIPGKDSIPVWGMPGELIVPTRNFDEVINAVANQRAGVSNDLAPQNGQGRLLIGFEPEAARYLTVKQNEDRALGISLENG